MSIYFTKEHEWVKVEGSVGTVGISDHAAHELGDITFVELPKIGAVVTQFGVLGSIESVKAASDNRLPALKPVDTSAWKTYNDAAYPFSFKYEPSWKILPAKKQNGFYVLEIDPGAKFYDMKIYVSDSGYYYALDSLPVVETDIGGAKAFDVSNLLYAVKMGPYYYTFDNGLSTAMMDGFNAMVRTVKFQ